MNTIPITSFSNEKIKYIPKLRDKKQREADNKFIIEGYRELLRALGTNKIQFDSLYISPECFLGENEWQLIRRFQCKVFELPAKVFEKISYRDRPDGLLAIAKLPDYKFTYPDTISGDTFVIIEGVEKPGNLGTILRTAEGAGVSALFIADPKIDLFNPNVVRSSTGTLFTFPVYITDIESITNYFSKQNIPIYSITPEAKKYYFEENLNSRLVLVFGSEQYGLSDTAKKKSNQILSIPMKGMADSLNLAMSCGILFYDVLRQRINQ